MFILGNLFTREQMTRKVNRKLEKEVIEAIKTANNNSDLDKEDVKRELMKVIETIAVPYRQLSNRIYDKIAPNNELIEGKEFEEIKELLPNYIDSINYKFMEENVDDIYCTTIFKNGNQVTVFVHLYSKEFDDDISLYAKEIIKQFPLVLAYMLNRKELVSLSDYIELIQELYKLNYYLE